MPSVCNYWHFSTGYVLSDTIMCELTTVCVLPGLRSLRHTISPLELLRGHTILEYFPTSSKSNDMKENSLFLQTQNIWTLTTVPLSLSHLACVLWGTQFGMEELVPLLRAVVYSMFIHTQANPIIKPSTDRQPWATDNARERRHHDFAENMTFNLANLNLIRQRE
jgi:hypothetical protein